jgi:hypothetical protein
MGRAVCIIGMAVSTIVGVAICIIGTVSTMVGAAIGIIGYGSNNGGTMGNNSCRSSKIGSGATTGGGG